MEGWYVAKSKPQKEASLVRFLSQWDVEVFFPQVVHSTRTGRQLQALFPTYLFCHLDPESSVWPVVRWAPGMAYFLAFDGQPTRVPQTLVDYLRQRVGQLSAEGPSRHLAPGDKVTVLSGPFTGLEGIFQRYVPGRQRCRILLEVVGRLTSTELPEWDVQEVGDIPSTRRMVMVPAS